MCSALSQALRWALVEKKKALSRRQSLKYSSIKCSKLHATNRQNRKTKPSNLYGNHSQSVLEYVTSKNSIECCNFHHFYFDNSISKVTFFLQFHFWQWRFRKFFLEFSVRHHFLNTNIGFTKESSSRFS